MKLTSTLLIILLLPLLIAADKQNTKKLTYSQKLEISIHNAINDVRIQYSLKGFIYSKKLSAIARAHSRDMVKRNFTSHVNPDGLNPSQRAKKAGFNTVIKTKKYIRKGIGENIFENYTATESQGVVTPFLENIDAVTKKAVKGWMNSPGHRKNILNPDYTKAGIGIAVSKDKKIKVTQVFF